jgi:release factor glutamine methyltransferase
MSEDKRTTGREAFSQACAQLQNAGFDEEDAIKDAMELLGFCMDKTWLKLMLAIDEPLDPNGAARFSEMVTRLAQREPMAYITGRQSFAGDMFVVAPGVLIPREDSTILIHAAIEAIKAKSAPKVLELGSGSGAIIASLAMKAPHIRGVAVDIEPVAIQVTQENLRRHGLAGRIEGRQGSWFAPIGDQEKFDLIMSNPPYITTNEMNYLSESVRKEPKTALWGGDDGLDCYRQILPGALLALNDAGYCMVEIGWKHGRMVRELFVSAGFADVRVLCDDAGRDRVVVGLRA